MFYHWLPKKIKKGWVLDSAVWWYLKHIMGGYWVENVFLCCICWMLNSASQFDILCNLPEIKGCQILHPFSALDIFEWWQNLDFSPFVSCEGGKSGCWHYPEIKKGDQVCKISHFEKKIYCPTWGFDPPKIRISEEFSSSRGRCAKCKRFATLIMRECNI